MSGSPTEAEIQTQWRNVVNLLESTRAFADDTVANNGGLLDVLEQSLEGDFTPLLANSTARFRATLSSLIDPAAATEMLDALVQEYAAIIAADVGGGFGSGYATVPELMTALYEHFHENSLTVQSRGIAYDTAATTGATNTGNGSMARLTVDENGYDLEACTVERKIFRCRADKNSGVQQEAESFEFVGSQASFDSLLRSSHGSGTASAQFIQSKNAGGGGGGSILRNSSFSDFDADNTANEKFAGWTQADGAAALFGQDTTNTYRTTPGVTTEGSLQFTGGSGTVRVTQSLQNMRQQQLDPDTPYFLRVMFNAEVGTATGSLTIRMGTSSKAVAVTGLTGWRELAIDFNEDCWFRNFNEEDLTVEIQWNGTSGTLLIDDVIFAPWDFIDGTYWLLRASSSSHTPWAVDDTLAFTDTGGAPASGKIQWWLYVSGLGYLPSSDTPTFAEP